MSTSVWPYDAFVTPTAPIEESIDTVTCFVASPFEPKKRWDDLFQLIQSVAADVGQNYNIPIKVFRADSIASSGIIHPEIWTALRTADFIICDVSGQNGNVMLELGVAAAWRRKEHVIILRNQEDDRPRLFDINPARHLEYEISFGGLQKLASDLGNVISQVLATIPFEIPRPIPITLPFHASLADGCDVRELYTEDITHRRLLADCLEFGTPLVYRHSWMSLGDLSLSRVRVRALMRMTSPVRHLHPFMGVMVRGQHYYSNLGHLVLVREDGKVSMTVREDDTGKSHDELLGTIPGFDISGFADFDISIDDGSLSGKVNQTEFSQPLANLKYVFTAGRVIFIAGFCRIGIRNITVDAI